MTDKEQIKCKYKFQDKEKFDGKTYCTCFCELCEDLPLCDDNCQIYEDFKQLSRKTQECEELKKELNGSEKWRIKAESLNEKLELNNGRYRKALEEIEKYINNQGINNKWNMRIQRFRMGILDIISRAKGEIMEIK